MIELERKYKAIVHYEHFFRSLRAVANIYKVSKSSLQRWCKTIPNIRKQRSYKQIGSEIKGCIQSELASSPMLTMSELCHKVSVACKVNPSINTIGRLTDMLPRPSLTGPANPSECKKYTQPLLCMSLPETMWLLQQTGGYVFL